MESVSFVIFRRVIFVERFFNDFFNFTEEEARAFFQPTKDFF